MTNRNHLLNSKVILVLSMSLWKKVSSVFRKQPIWQHKHAVSDERDISTGTWVVKVLARAPAYVLPLAYSALQ